MALAQDPDAELALGGIETLTEPKKAEPWMRPVELAGAALLVAMMGIVLVNVFCRYVLHHPLVLGGRGGLAGVHLDGDAGRRDRRGPA